MLKVLFYIITILTGLLGVGLLAGFSQSRHKGLLIAGLIALTSATTAIIIHSWWPLLIGFVLAWILRLMGGDPSYR